jgi:hypothetical protein
MQLFQAIQAINIASGKQTDNIASASKILTFVM